MEIGEPVVLARLVHASRQKQRPFCVQIQGIRDGAKRRRQELCSAVEGNSISIHEAQNGRLLSSYLFAPGTTFLCPPVSIHEKTDNGIAIRRTYCATERLGVPQVECVLETLQGDKSDVQRKQIQLGESFGTVARIDYLSQAATEVVVVLSITGNFITYNIDLSSRAELGQLSFPEERDHQVLQYHGFTISEAATTVLKGRPDVVNAAGVNAIVISALLQAVAAQDSQPKSLTHLVWTIPISKQTSIPRAYPAIASHHLNLSAPFNLQQMDSLHYSFKGPRLCIATSTRLVTLDFSAITPRVESDLVSPVSEALSCIPIADYLALYSTSSSLCLYNTQFRSLQASQDLSQRALKRSRGGEIIGPLRFVAYLPRLSRVIAIRRDNIMSIDVHVLQGTDATRGLKSSSLLVNNIGKGLSSHDRTAKVSSKVSKTAIGLVKRPGSFGDNWNSTVKQLNEALSKKDSTIFEDTFVKHVQTNAGLERWHSRIPIPEGEIDYLLCAIFSLPDGDDHVTPEIAKLKIALQAPRLIQWLTTHGFLTSSRIARATSSRTRKESDHNIFLGGLVSALAESDVSLSLLNDFLSNTPCIDPANLGTAIAILIRAARNEPEASTPLKIELISHIREDNQEDTAAGDVERDSSDIGPVRPSPISNVTQLLGRTLERLADIDSRSIASTIRTHLEQQDLVALVQFLRQELYKSGHTRSVQSQAHLHADIPTNTSNGPNDTAISQGSELSLDVILTIMSGCVDVIGPLGLLSTDSETQFIQTLIPELLTEIKRTMEAVNDAAHLQGLLRETIRYMDTAQVKTVKGAATGSQDHATQKPNTITVVYSEAADGSGDMDNMTALPLGSKDAAIDSRKVRKGGGKLQERSKREMGMLQDRTRGPYALERLVF